MPTKPMSDLIENVFSQHFKIADDYTEENIRDAMANLIEQISKENEQLKEQIKMHSHITAEQSVKLDKLYQSIKRQRGDNRLDEIEGKDY